jgi:hypothetical protein
VTNKEKCLKIKEMMFGANGIENGKSVRSQTKWRNLEDLAEYLAEFGGSIKYDRKRRRGYFVVHLYDSKEDEKPVCAEITKDFGEKVMVMGGFP